MDYTTRQNLPHYGPCSQTKLRCSVTAIFTTYYPDLAGPYTCASVVARMAAFNYIAAAPRGCVGIRYSFRGS